MFKPAKKTSIPITKDPEVMRELRNHFPQYKNIPITFPDENPYNDRYKQMVFKMKDYLSFLLTDECSPIVSPRPNRISFLSPEQNLEIRRYLEADLATPRAMLVDDKGDKRFGHKGCKQESSDQEVEIYLGGNPPPVKLWWSKDLGVIKDAVFLRWGMPLGLTINSFFKPTFWNKYMTEPVFISFIFEPLMSQLWDYCEDFLQSQGVGRIYACVLPLDGDSRWFRTFLTNRNYQPFHHVHYSQSQQEVMFKSL